MRKLLGTLALTVGLLSLTLSVRADPIGTCTDSCVNASTGYACDGSGVGVFELTTCIVSCAGTTPGWARCQTPAVGGTCTETKDENGKVIQLSYNIYENGFELCPDACKGKGGGNLVHGFPGIKKIGAGKTERWLCVK